MWSPPRYEGIVPNYVRFGEIGASECDKDVPGLPPDDAFIVIAPQVRGLAKKNETFSLKKERIHGAVIFTSVNSLSKENVLLGTVCTQDVLWCFGVCFCFARTSCLVCACVFSAASVPEHCGVFDFTAAGRNGRSRQGPAGDPHQPKPQ